MSILSERCRARLIPTLIAVALGLVPACAAMRGPADEPDRPRTARDAAAADLVEDAERAFEAANYVAAESLAAGVVRDYPATEWLGPALLVAGRAAFERNLDDVARMRAARYLTLYRASDPARVPALILLARILNLEGDPAEAADSLLATPGDLGDWREDAFQIARRLAGQLGLQEIEEITGRWPPDHPLQSVFEIERASLMMVAGDREPARSLARRALERGPPDPERVRAERILTGEVDAERWRPTLGAILPMSGRLSGYGQAVEEGMRLAIREYNDRHADSVTLIIKDDADDFRRDGELARELEEMGAVAIIGPLRSQGLERAAESRRDDDLLLVSPTAPEDLRHLRNVYSLWTTRERSVRDSRALAGFAVRELKLYRYGVLHPNNAEGQAQAEAFAEEVRSWGAEVVESISYEESATTFQAQIETLKLQEPQAIYAPAASPQTVIQMAPQFSFYGLRGVQILGDEDWSTPQVLRLVEPRFINGAVLSTFLHRSSPAVRWPEFVELYERTYRKGLQDNLVPALAFDAARLVLTALPWGAPRRSAIARSLRETQDLPGATGILSVREGSVLRRPFILEIRDRELLPPALAPRPSLTPAEGSGAR